MATTSYEVIRKKRNGILHLYGDGFSYQEDDRLLPEPLGVWNQIDSLKINRSKNMIKIVMNNNTNSNNGGNCDDTGPVLTFLNYGDLDRVKEEIAARQTLAQVLARNIKRDHQTTTPHYDPVQPAPGMTTAFSAPPQTIIPQQNPVPLLPPRPHAGAAQEQQQPLLQQHATNANDDPEREQRRISAKPLPPPKQGLGNGMPQHHEKQKVTEEWSEEPKRWKLVHYIYVLCVFTTIWCAVTAFSLRPTGNLMKSADVAASNVHNGKGCKNGMKYCVCPRETICATELETMIYLGIARSVVYFVYPFIWFLFLSKANFLHSWLQTTVVSVVVDFSEFHHLHRWGGILVEGATWIHVFFHLLRWGVHDDDIKFLWQSQTGLTGLIATIIMPFITWPMAVGFIKTRLNYEIRKSLHYLSWVWGVCLILHAPMAHIKYLCGVPIMIYWLNWVIGCFWGTHLVPSTTFRRLESGVSMTFDNPRGFELKGPSYIVVMLPWISKYQWHAFSIFPQQDHSSNQSSVCIAAVGDWSQKLHATTLRPTSRPAWISGPFLSPFATAIHFDNIITLATGIGITPGLCTVNMYRGTRRINLVWMCRDPSFVEFFVSTVDFPPDAFVLVYYTGKKQLVLPDHIPSNIFIFAGRPALERVVTGLVECIEKGEGLPEDIVEEGKAIRDLDPARKFRAVLSRLLKIYSEDRIYESCLEASKEASTTTTGQVDAAADRKKREEELHSAAQLRNRRGSTNVSQQPHNNRRRSSGGHSLGDQMGAAVAITKEGLTTAVNHFLGYNEFTPADIDAIFDLFDADRSGVIDQEEYEAMMDYVYSANDDEIDPAWGIDGGTDVEQAASSFGKNMAARHFFSPVKKGEISTKSKSESYASQQDLSTWQMLYCGGSAPVVEQLEMINKKYSIDLKIEKFDW